MRIAVIVQMLRKHTVRSRMVLLAGLSYIGCVSRGLPPLPQLTEHEMPSKNEYGPG